jgi:hypothetical protein
MGTDLSGIFSDLIPWFTDNNAYWSVNDSGSVTATTATTVKGMWAVSRTGQFVAEKYLNGAANVASVNTSGALSINSFLILARRQGASNAPSEWSADQLSAAFIGGGLNATQAAQVSTRINAYMTALGINVY